MQDRHDQNSAALGGGSETPRHAPGHSPPFEAGEHHDPFVALLRWLARAHGGLDTLAAESGIGLRTLQDWHQGRYPRQRQSPKVVELHQWALRNDSTYPPDWAPHGGLADLAGPARIQIGGLTPSAEPAVAEVPPDPPGGSTRHPKRWLLWLAPVVLVAAVAATVVVLVTGGSALPTAPAGAMLRAETSGSLGANVFTNPRPPSGEQLLNKVPPRTTIEVSCRYLKPSLPSLKPDGYWYLIVSARWRGEWTPANSYLDGDPPNGPFHHNTDFAVPVCR
jgi:hypothetical protein